MAQQTTQTQQPQTPATQTQEAPAQDAAKAAFLASIGAVAARNGMPANVGEPPAQAPAAPAKEQPKAGDEPAKGRNTDPAETRYERARRAMLRSGMTADEFSRIPKDQAIRRGLKQERKLNREATAFAATQAAAQKKGQSSPQDAAANALSNAQAPAPDGLTELFARLGIEDDEEAQAQITKHLSPVLAENRSLKAELDQRKAAGPSDVNQETRVANVRAELTKVVSELGDDDEWNAVGLMAHKMADLPQYADALSNDETLMRLFRDATTLALEIEVGERAAPFSSQGAARWGVVETSGATPHLGVNPQDPMAVGRALFSARMPEIARKYAAQLSLA